MKFFLFNKLKFFLVTIFFVSISLMAQQEIQNSLYMFNPGSVNPAYAGSRDAISGVLNYRQQWSKWDGAPKTTMLNMNGPLKAEALALGLNLVNDKIGAISNTAMYGDFAYRIKLNKRKFGTRNKQILSFGIRVGGDYFTSNFTKLVAFDGDDQIQTLNNYSTFKFNVGAGVYYYGKKHYLGFAVPKLIQNQKLNVADIKSKQVEHYYFVAGYIYIINSVVTFKPSMQIKYTKNAPISVELNASFLCVDKFWIGAVYRYKAAIGLNISYQFSDALKVGYAYDYSTTQMANFKSNSHEIMIGFDLSGNRNSMKSPLYF